MEEADIKSPASEASPAGKPHLEAEMDQVSLDQALKDLEVANARVIDLTQRLIESAETNAKLREELATTQAEHHRLISSKAWKIARRIWALRRRLNV